MINEVGSQQNPHGNQGVEGLFPFVDGGVSEETVAAEKETKTFLKVVEADKLSGQEKAEAIRQEPDLVKRAKALHGANLMAFVEVQSFKNGDDLARKAVSTDTNRWAAFDCLFGNGSNRPHLNEFRGRCVDHHGAIFDDRTDMTVIVKALDALGLKTQSADMVRKSLKEWCLHVRRNDQIELMNRIVPEWDGKPRIASMFVDLFKSHDTPMVRSLSEYFFLSLYNRITNPGCLAPIVVSLIGGQDTGKSYFGKLICEVLMDDPHADATPLNLDMKEVDFLRSITGESLIAAIGEMSGFDRGDLNKIKALVTRVSDKFDYKFEGHFTQPRSWVAIMDGNAYDGLQRDSTGNRRFAPVFVGQLDDLDGKPNWIERGFKVDFSTFRADLLQAMAECRHWIETHGQDGYKAMVAAASNAVRDFNDNEMRNDRGTIKDVQLDNNFAPAMIACKKFPISQRKGEKRSGVAIYRTDFGAAFMELTRGREPNWNRVDIKMVANGAEVRRMTGNKPGYFFQDMTADSLIAKFQGSDDWTEGAEHQSF